VEDGVTVYRIGHGGLFWLEDWARHSAATRYVNKMLTNWNPITGRRVREVIREFKPDVINSHCMLHFAVDCWKVAAEEQVPVVHALHEFNLVCRNTNAFRNGHMCKTMCLACRINEPKRWLSRHVSSVIGVSRDVLQRHLDFGFFNHVPPSRRAIIWSMPPIQPQERSSRPQNQPFTIGFIGRIVPEKGLEVLLDAVAKLPKNGWRLVIAGKVFPPLDPDTLRARAAGLPVEWLGVVPAAQFYPQIDVLVVPAIWADPGPLVVHEAFANSVPVIGAKMGGITDFIEHDSTGWLYPPNDADALAAILAQRIAAGRGALPHEDAFSRFRAQTTPDRVAEHYEEIYRLTTKDFQMTTGIGTAPAFGTVNTR
jgi:glycosyltransferase involved in cell wall biosynthesis